MAFTIRRALLTDAAEIAQVHIRSWEVAYTGIVPEQTIAEKNAMRPAFWQSFLSVDDGKGKFAICEDEQIAGLMILESPNYEGEEDNTLEVGCMYMSPDFFGKGYGRKAMEFAVDFAKDNGFKKIILWVLEENVGARAFYEKCGYIFDGEKKEYVIGKPLIALKYAKRL